MIMKYIDVLSSETAVHRFFTGLSCNFLKKKLQHRCLLVSQTKFLITPIYRTPSGTASVSFDKFKTDIWNDQFCFTNFFTA